MKRLHPGSAGVQRHRGGNRAGIRRKIAQLQSAVGKGRAGVCLRIEDGFRNKGKGEPSVSWDLKLMKESLRFGRRMAGAHTGFRGGVQVSGENHGKFGHGGRGPGTEERLILLGSHASWPSQLGESTPQELVSAVGREMSIHIFPGTRTEGNTPGQKEPVSPKCRLGGAMEVKAGE